MVHDKVLLANYPMARRQASHTVTSRLRNPDIVAFSPHLAAVSE
jgi:hypothetical protein